jgi:hypothetical protein
MPQLTIKDPTLRRFLQTQRREPEQGWPETVYIDEEVWAHLQQHARAGEDPEDTLARLLGEIGLYKRRLT